MAMIEGYRMADVETEVPLGAVIFHRVNRETTVTYHPLDSEGGGVRVLPGRPMARSEALDLLHTLAGEYQDELSWTPNNVLAQGGERLAWFVPGRVRPMLFRGPNGTTVTLQIPWPTLVFNAGAGWIKVAALASGRRPGPRSRLYHAPRWNTSADGSVCLGSATVPELSGFSAMAGYEEAVYDTLFSHPNFAGNLNYRQGRDGSTSDVNYLRFWRTQAKSGKTAFPKERLVPMSRTLHEFLALGC